MDSFNKLAQEIQGMFFNNQLNRKEEGEESRDIWKAYHKNGKVQHVNAQLVFEEFNKSKLQ